MTKDEALKLALERAFYLGQVYWQQADSEYSSHWKKADETKAKFKQLVEDAIKEALAQPELTLDGLTPTEFALRELYEFQEATGCDTAAEFKAQPEQEPVAWGMMNDDGKIYDCICPEEHDRVEGEYTVPLYTTPPHRKPLTDDELRVIENKINPNMRWRSSDEEGITLYPIEYYELVRAIEAAHGIKE